MINRILLFLVFLLTASPAYALEIFYPADGTYVIHSDFLIIKAGPNIDGLTLEIGGEKSDLLDISSEEYRAAFDDFLIVEPAWDAGENTVVVEAYRAGKKVAEEKAVFFFQDNPTVLPPEGYSRFIMHKPEKEAFCAGCHNMNPTPAQLEMVGAKNPCASCHKRMLEHKNVHGPAGAWQCGYCHDSKSSPVRYAPRSGRGDLCAECHQEIAGDFKMSKKIHGPVEVGMCNVCHDSHASDHAAQVLRPINETCLFCHEGIDKEGHVGRGISGNEHPLNGLPDPSRVSRELSCTSCHNPHSGNSTFLFVQGIENRFSLCQVCHKK